MIRIILPICVVLIVSFGDLTSNALAEVVSFTPTGTNTVSIDTELSWDMQSSRTSVGRSELIDYYPVAPFDLTLTDHGDIHFEGDTAYVTEFESSNLYYDSRVFNVQPGTMIDSSSFFSDSWGATWSTFWDSRVHFSQSSRGLIGLRLKIDGATHYGWSEIEFSGGTHTVHGWGYNDEPNVGIRAGAVSVPEPSSLVGMLSVCTAVCRSVWPRRKPKHH